MKRVLLLVASCLVVAGSAHARMYVRGGVGPSFSLGSVVIAHEEAMDAGVFHSKSVNGTYGRGIEFAGAIGCALSPALSVELGVTCNLGPEYDTHSSAFTDTRTAHLFGIAPAIVLSGGRPGESKLRPYARLGATLAFPALKDVYTQSGDAAVTFKYSGGLLMCFTGGLGLDVPVAGKLTAFGEASVSGGSWAPSEVEITEGSRTTTYALKAEYDSSESGVQQQLLFPFGNIGLRAGLKFGL